eukprot:754124-Hanusia_phi.AAC.4
MRLGIEGREGLYSSKAVDTLSQDGWKTGHSCMLASFKTQHCSQPRKEIYKMGASTLPLSMGGLLDYNSIL